MSHKVTFVGSGDAFGSGGRFQTCILVEGPTRRVAIDFGASSLIALKRLGLEHNAIDAILLTHFHGDHCGGIPFLLMDAMLGAKRRAPLVVAGPRDIEAKLARVREAMFPGMGVMKPAFAVRYVEMELMKPNPIVDGVIATPYPAVHTKETNPTSIRVDVEGKTVSYTGDSAWNEHLPRLAKDADLLVAESYFHAKPVRFHLNYPDISGHREELRAKRTILTHMGPEMLARVDEVSEETAYDGLVVEL